MSNKANEFTTNVNGLARDFKHQVQNTGASLETISHNAGMKVGAIASDLATSASKYAKSSRDYVEENPGKSIAIAAAAGVVAGSLLMMAFRRKN